MVEISSTKHTSFLLTAQRIEPYKVYCTDITTPYQPDDLKSEELCARFFLRVRPSVVQVSVCMYVCVPERLYVPSD